MLSDAEVQVDNEQLAAQWFSAEDHAVRLGFQYSWLFENGQLDEANAILKAMYEFISTFKEGVAGNFANDFLRRVFASAIVQRQSEIRWRRASEDRAVSKVQADTNVVPTQRKSSLAESVGNQVHL